MPLAFESHRKTAPAVRRAAPLSRFPAADSSQHAPKQPQHRGCACGGGCPRCQHAKHAELSHLRIAAADSPLEREADAAAAQVAIAQPAQVQPQGPGPLQLSRDTSSPGATSSVSAPASVHDVLASPGQPLSNSTRAEMEGRFGHDFADVRIHTDAAAADSAQTVNAHAYTVGHEIVFDSGRHSPTTAKGRRLIAHELTHVVQQSRGGLDLLQRAPATPTPEAGPLSDGQTSPPMFSINVERPGKDTTTGHAWVALDDGKGKHRAWGFYPACADCSSQALCSDWDLGKIATGQWVAGKVCNDSRARPTDQGIYFISPEKYEDAMGMMASSNPLVYNLWTYNCVDYVRSVAETFAVFIPDFPLIDEPEELGDWIASGKRGQK